MRRRGLTRQGGVCAERQRRGRRLSPPICVALPLNVTTGSSLLVKMSKQSPQNSGCKRKKGQGFDRVGRWVLCALGGRDASAAATSGSSAALRTRGQRTHGRDTRWRQQRVGRHRHTRKGCGGALVGRRATRLSPPFPLGRRGARPTSLLCPRAATQGGGQGRAGEKVQGRRGSGASKQGERDGRPRYNSRKLNEKSQVARLARGNGAEWRNNSQVRAPPRAAARR